MLPPRREKEPPICAGDEIIIEKGGAAGRWTVRAARFEDGGNISVVLSKGGSQTFKTRFNETTMRHKRAAPVYMLSRDIGVGGKIRLKRKSAAPEP